MFLFQIVRNPFSRSWNPCIQPPDGNRTSIFALTRTSHLYHQESSSMDHWLAPLESCSHGRRCYDLIRSRLSTTLLVRLLIRLHQTVEPEEIESADTVNHWYPRHLSRLSSPSMPLRFLKRGNLFPRSAGRRRDGQDPRTRHFQPQR